MAIGGVPGVGGVPGSLRGHKGDVFRRPRSLFRKLARTFGCALLLVGAGTIAVEIARLIA